MRTRRYADNSLRICDTVHDGEIKFGKCLSCGKFRSRNSCAYRNAKYFKCGMIGYILSVCNTKIYSAATNAKNFGCDPTDLGVSNDDLLLSTTSKSHIELHSRPELDETENPCETRVSNQSTYQISHLIVPYMVFNDHSHIFDETAYKSEENMLSEPNHDGEAYVLLTDNNFSNDPVLCNDIPRRFQETISEASNPDII
ncbi:unnamed protein product [Schistosoma curassoni]|uniref:Retrovirus-related Pol polyprotein from transposon TNT 1-94 n=1 Tax=Schistosoma curassoni TaxID=6186 RepID=A0A183JQC3_9TREM|nr:unnamed protein product [Schistosoma curassoni]